MNTYLKQSVYTKCGVRYFFYAFVLQESVAGLIPDGVTGIFH